MYLKDREGSPYRIIDIEGNGLKPSVLWCAVVKELDTGRLVELVGHDEIKKYISQQSASTIWVGHNALSYDAPNLNRLLSVSVPMGNVVDTLVLSYLYTPGLSDEYGKHSLEAYGNRFGMPKIGHEDWSQFSLEMLSRCRQDVLITEKLFGILRSKMNRVGFSELSCEVEHHIREVVDWQEEYGFGFDAQDAMLFLNELVTLGKTYEAEVHKQFRPALKHIKTLKYHLLKDGREPNSIIENRAKYPKCEIVGEEFRVYELQDFNLGSPQQRLKRLEEMGYEPVNLTKKGNPQVDEDGILAFLEWCPEDAKPAVSALANWLVVNARTKAVTEWLEAYNPATGAIHGRVYTCGAESRRATHNSPNTANVPSNEARYGERCRSLWRARPGRVLLGGDAKAVQMRMFAHYLGNVEVGMQYVEGDPHKRNAEAAGIPRKKVKNCFYAMIFGAQDKRLGKTGHGGTGTKEQGAAIRVALYGTTPGLEALFNYANRKYEENSGWMECIDGGWVRCPGPHAALNYWVQSAEAILMKIVAWKVFVFIRRNKLDARQVGFIHDELQYDCLDFRTADLVAKEFLRAMAETGEELKFIIPQAGDCKFAINWAGTH